LFEVKIITPEETVLRCSAGHLVAPGIMKGRFGILKDHAPLFSLLEKGRLRIDIKGGDKKYFSIQGGILEVADNRVTILMDALPGQEEA
jgi:F-type H+-transporting ATPase subunit epsilon